MKLDPIAVGRLAKLQKYPVEFIERRVENIDLKDDRHYAVTVTQQLIIPTHGLNDTVETTVLVPIGYYSKSLLPDLRVAGADGTELPVANRADRGRITAIIITSAWENVIFDAVSAGDHASAESMLTIIQAYIGHIATEQPLKAQEAYEQLNVLVAEWSSSSNISSEMQNAATSLLGTPDFWTAVQAMVDTRLIVATMEARPGSQHVLTSTYTERFSYVKQGSMRWLVSLVQWLGWSAYGTSRRTANLGRTRSLWVIQTLPPGVEPVRSYWEDRANVPEDDVALIAESDRTVANRYDEVLPTGEKPPSLLLDAQVAPSASIAIATLLALLLLGITTYIYQAPKLFTAADAGLEQTNFIALAGVFAAVPAAVGAALAYNGQTFVRRLSRGPRLVLSLLSIQAALLAVLICLKRTTHAIEISSLVLSIYSLVAAGVFGFVWLGPRWRKSRRSRLRLLTAPATPEGCRLAQQRIASAYLGMLTLAVVVFARCQTSLRYAHFFTRHFPTNIWHAWWSWL